jgi:putative effector of murein hydrolase
VPSTDAQQAIERRGRRSAGVAMSNMQALGGDPGLITARLRDLNARSLAVGLASHRIGTARASQVDQGAGTFAGIAIGLNAWLTAILVPPVLAPLVR